MRIWSLILSGAIFLVFLFQCFFPDITQSFSLVFSLVLQEPWRVLTHVFVHSGLLHVSSNLFALLIFGFILENTTNSRVFLSIFFVSAVVSSLADILFYSKTIGASGAIFGILGCLAVLRPKTLVWVFGVPMYLIFGIFIWASLDMLGMFYPDNIAHASHLFGMLFGIVAGIKLREKYPEPKKPERIKIPESELEEWERKWFKL